MSIDVSTPDIQYRRFKKGDKVQLISHRGRNPFYEGMEYEPGEVLYIVEHDELPGGTVTVYEIDECDAFDVHFSNLMLVTPVDEVRQFYLESDTNMLFYILFGTRQNYELVARLNKKYYSLTDALAECDRLNEEHRKEQE